jgi:hypothetical protein
MSPLATSVIVFACVCGGALLGTFFSALLPQAQMESDSRDVVRLTMGLVATTVAIVLGMLVASAKSFYDTQNSEVTQMAANFLLLDCALAHYGQETTGTRAALRVFLPRLSGLLGARDRPFDPVREGEALFDKIQELSPKDDNQRFLKLQATSLAIQIGQLRWLVFEQKTVPIPRLLLLMLISWLTVLFVSFGLFGPRNATVTVGLLTSALAVCGAIFLILELYHPDTGLLRVTDAPLRAAVAQLGQ